MEDPDRRNIPRDYGQTKLLRWSLQHRFIIRMAVVALACFLAAVILGIVFTIYAPASDSIGFELLKFIIQFLLIVVLGAVVAVGVELAKMRIDSEARQRQYEVDILTSLLARLDELYQAIKRERRALGVMQLSNMTYEDYATIMRRLSDRKQDAERIWRDVEVLKNWISSLEGIQSLGESMEHYLGKLEGEWERVAAAPEIEFKVEQLTELRLFRAKSGSGDPFDFYELRTPYYKARQALITSLSRRRTG